MNLFTQEFSQIGNKSNLGELAAAVSDQEISDYVFNVLNTPGLSDQDRAAQIANAAVQYGVSNEDIARATGYTVIQVVDYLNLAIPERLKINIEPKDVMPSQVFTVPDTKNYGSTLEEQNPQFNTSNEIFNKPIVSTVTNEPYYAPIVSTVTSEPKKNTTSGVSYSEVKRVVDYYLSDTRLTDQDRAAAIQGYARYNNISVNELSEITGFSTDEISNYFAIAFHPSLQNAAQKIIDQNKKNEEANAAIAAANVKAAQDAAIAAAKAKAAQDAAIAANNAKAAQDAAIAAANAKAAQDAAIQNANNKARSDALKASESNAQARAAQDAADKAKALALKNAADATAATNAKVAQDVANLAKLKADTDAENAKKSEKVVLITTETKSIQPNVIQTNQSSNSGILILAAIAAYLIGS